MIPAVVASDVDGTLLASHRVLSPATADELRALHEEGVVVVALTARPARLLRVVEPLWPLVRFAVCDDLAGATMDTQTDKLVTATTWDPRDLDLLADELRVRVPALTLALESFDGTIAEHEFARLAGDQIDVEVTQTVRVLAPDRAATKLMAIADGYGPEALCAALSPGLNTRCRLTHSGSAYVEIGPPSTSKAAALAVLCEAWGVQAANVVAFGDMPDARTSSRGRMVSR